MILEMLSGDIKYFCGREPLERMDRRDAKKTFEGDSEEGKKWQKWLRERENPVDKVVALGEILCVIRSNLVHGSKNESGDDKEIIDHSIIPLETLLSKVLSMTKNKCLWQ